MNSNNNQQQVLTSANAIIVLEDGKAFYGKGIGAMGITSGEICFNTAITGYQEIMSDPSYLDQIITFTFPHIGIVGTNNHDMESLVPKANGLVIRNNVSIDSNFRSIDNLENWLKKYSITGIASIDTRSLAHHIRKQGAQNAVICYNEQPGDFDFSLIYSKLSNTPSHKGLELASKASNSCNLNYHIQSQTLKRHTDTSQKLRYKIVVIDFGVKLSILDYLKKIGCDLVVAPARSSYEEIMSYNPDGIFLSNGPGDPAATAKYALPVIRKLIDIDIPIFGICLGHQLLALAIGAKIEKMYQGHRGSNHPVKDMISGKICITSQNHGFVVKKDSLPHCMEITHISLFDNSIEGIAHIEKPVFSVQYHPEASPGPHDSTYLFNTFLNLLSRFTRTPLEVKAG